MFSSRNTQKKNFLSPQRESIPWLSRIQVGRSNHWAMGDSWIRIPDKAPSVIRDIITLCSSRCNLRNDYILSLQEINTTKCALKSWRYFAVKKWNELRNDIRINVGNNEVSNKIRNLKFDWYRNWFSRFLVLWCL